MKGVASGVTVSVAFVCIFAVVKLFPFGLQYLTPSGTYAFFAVVIEIRISWQTSFIVYVPTLTSGEPRHGSLHCVLRAGDQGENITGDSDNVWRIGSQAGAHWDH